MGSVLNVKQEEATGDWLVREGDGTLARFPRLQDARAYARAELLDRGKGSVVVYTPSGRRRETLNVRHANGRRVIQAA
jgi:hypothetical protein